MQKASYRCFAKKNLSRLLKLPGPQHFNFKIKLHDNMLCFS